MAEKLMTPLAFGPIFMERMWGERNGCLMFDV